VETKGQHSARADQRPAEEIDVTVTPSTADVDVIVTCASFTGLYGVQALRDQLGLSLQTLDSARVVAAGWDGANDVWMIVTDDGRTTTSRFLVCGGVRTGSHADREPLLEMQTTGRDRVRLADWWARGPRTYLGLTVAKLPNLFIVGGPQTLPSPDPAMVVEHDIDFIVGTLRYMAEHGHTVVEPSAQAEAQWVAETAVAPVGAAHRQAIRHNVQRGGYRGFRFSGSSDELGGADFAPALDPSLMVVAETLRTVGFTGFRAAGVDGVRAAIDGVMQLQAPAPGMASVRELAYGSDPGQRLRVYTPHTSEHTDGALPVVVHLHGGGFVAGGLDPSAEPARDLAVRTGAIVISATYRRAPEHTFPAAHDDAYAAVRWTVARIADLGGDPSRIALAGDSVGGNLAIAAALAAAQDGIDLAGLLLICPLVDATTDTVSRHEFATGHLLELDDLVWLVQQYVSSTTDVMDPRLAVFSADLSDLPPTLVIANECDPLRDEAELLVEHLHLFDVDAAVQTFDGLAHGAFWMSGAVAGCADQRRAAADFLVARLSPARSDAMA
jgi:acetyl esterase/lipase